ncbi:protein TRC8 homolog [Sitophilus oryzae]|uniref:Protein TRC8 homolog n=1 Tax=Sitophilus oryzae TaxID=7048 RepID=A0A6J2XIK1_SITOR|nr:protein TRC8 homolog [Sitophilus oryzae]
MSLRAKVLGVVEVLLRVPPLFVIDEILKIGFGLSEYYQDLSDSSPDYSESLDGNYKVDETFSNITTFISLDPKVSKYIFLSVIRLLLAAVGCISAMCMFALNTKHLMVVYLYLTSIGIAILSYFTNLRTVKNAPVEENILEEPITLIQFYNTFNFKGILENRELLENYILQGILGFLFMNIHLGPRYSLIQKFLPITFLGPSFFASLPTPKAYLKHIPTISALLPFSIILSALLSSFGSISNALFIGYVQAKAFISNFGISALVEREWLRLNVPEVLRTFWLLRTIEHAGTFFLAGYWGIEDGHSPYFRLMKYLLVSGCDTLTAVLGLTSVVSYICNFIGKFFQWVLLTEDENDRNFGTVSAIVFYILALQTGLTGLEIEVRFVRLCRNFCLLFTALLHFTHNIVNPLLMSLSASHNPSIRRHTHALAVCAGLVGLSLSLMYLLWSTQDVSTWLLAVTAFSIEVIVKVMVSLAIYSLFLYDARRESFWEKLDDYIYYIRSFGNTIEFCFGIFLFFNGAWILLFESGSAIRAVMMCIHAYFNIWCDAKAGWSVFMKRRTAVNKIESLPEADREQLRNLDDVCAICYQEMQSAKITKCKHFFHGVCLRKWLYVQDRCPLCHEILHLIDSDEKTRSDDQEQADAEPLDIMEHHDR